MSQPRVVHAIRTVDSRQTGGPEELLLAACPLIKQRGDFDPAILLLRKPNPQADPAKDFGNRARATGIPVLPLQDVRWRPAWLRALPRRLGASVIHVHGQRANYFVWLMRRLFPRTWGRTPLVATVHGWVQDNTIRRVVTRLEWGTLRDCDHVITVSELQRQALLDMGFDPKRVSVVRPGVPTRTEGAGLRTEPFAHSVLSPQSSVLARSEARARWGIPQDAFVISGIGRLSTEKRFDLYLEACAALAPLLPEAYFMLVGGGKQEANLREFAAGLGLSDRLIFTGLTREMPAVYAATDVVMITSDTEGVPHVLLEAMAQGIPVVSTAVGGIPELVCSGESGLLVEPGDRQGLVDAVLRLHANPDLAAGLAAGGKAVVAGLTLDRLVEGFEEVYRQVLERQGQR